MDKKCKQEDIKKASETLDSAFKDYPVLKYYFPNTLERSSKIGFMHNWYIQNALKYFKGAININPNHGYAFN